VTVDIIVLRILFRQMIMAALREQQAS